MFIVYVVGLLIVAIAAFAKLFWIAYKEEKAKPKCWRCGHRMEIHGEGIECYHCGLKY